MKTRLVKNIDLVRIAVKNGVTDYIFPQNVAWADKVVEKIVVCAPQAVCVDPVDGTTAVMDASVIDNLYFSLYNESNEELFHDLSYESLSHRNNHVLPIGSKLNLSLSRLYFTDAPQADYTLLLYVFYEGRTVEDYEIPKRSVTVEFPLQANQVISLRDIMSTYIAEIPETLKGIVAWNAATAPAYLTLRDYKLTYNLHDVHTELMRPDMNAGSAQDSQAMVLYTDNLDIDFDYSHIREAAGQNSTQRLTFLY